MASSTLSSFFQGAEIRAPFLIEPRIKEKDYETVKLQRTLTPLDKRFKDVPKISIKDAELACHVCLVFDMAITQLALNTPQLLFDEFSKCLSLNLQQNSARYNDNSSLPMVIKTLCLGFEQRNVNLSMKSLEIRRCRMRMTI